MTALRPLAYRRRNSWFFFSVAYGIGSRPFSEREIASAKNDPDKFTFLWTAKEAVIKAERNSAIDWTNGITVEPFEVLAGETSFFARCGDRRYRLITRCAEGHYITVAVPVMP